MAQFGGSNGSAIARVSRVLRKSARSESRTRGKHQLRIVCGDPYIDWDKVKDREDLGPFLANRDQWYAKVVEEEVLMKRHRALLIMGSAHFLRRQGPSMIEKKLISSGAHPYLIVFGTNTPGSYDNLDHRFDAWRVPAIVALQDGWVGDLPAMPIISGGLSQTFINRGQGNSVIPEPQKLKDVIDALFYAGPRDRLTQVNMPAIQRCCGKVTRTTAKF